MDKAERDRIMNSMTQEDRAEYRRVIDQLKGLMKESGARRLTVKEMLETGKVKVPPEVRVPVEGVMERDEQGPKEGEVPPDFFLKRKGSDGRVRLSDFRGKRAVALVFGSYT